MKRQYYAVLVVLLRAIFFVFGQQKIGLVIVAIVGGAGALAFIAWGLTTYRRPADPRIVPLYLLTVACLHLPIMEEYLMGFAPRMSRLFGIPPLTEQTFMISFVFIGIALLQAEPPSGAYGMGWESVRIDGRRLINHDGATGNYQSSVFIDPEEQMGVFIAANAMSALTGYLPPAAPPPWVQGRSLRSPAAYWAEIQI